jgi:hypothetical protein
MNVAYFTVMRHIYDEGCLGAAGFCSILFDKSHIIGAVEKLGLKIRNLWDIRYNFDSREQLTIDGRNYCLLPRGKGRYALIPVEADAFITPKDFESILLVSDRTPSEVSALLSDDEQAMMGRLIYSCALATCLGLVDIVRVQDHWRTSSSLGQIEIDGVFIANFRGQRRVVFVSVKKFPNRISLAYIYALSIVAREKGIPGVLLLNIYMFDSTSSWIWACDPIDSISSPRIVANKIVVLV